jgi:sialic acid synthase SpsE
MTSPAPHPEVRIAGRRIVQHGEPFVVAEIGVNHDGVPVRARALVAAAASAGADAIKLQVFDPARLVTAAAATAGYQRDRGQGDTQRAMLERLVLSPDALAAAVALARELGLAVLATPFDEDSADLVAALGVDAIKIGSGDLTHRPLLAHVAGLGRPLVVSTGMATLDEVLASVAGIRTVAPALPLALLHCVSAYPAPPEAANLRVIPAMHAATGLPVGWSDHVPGPEAAIAAAALGAPLFERHLTLDRTARGPDHAASDEPEELAAYIRAIRRAHAALGSDCKGPAAVESDVRAAARRSVVARTPIPPGTIIEPSMLDVRRPGSGLPPSALPALLGRRSRVAIAADTLILDEMLDEEPPA